MSEFGRLRRKINQKCKPWRALSLLSPSNETVVCDTTTPTVSSCSSNSSSCCYSSPGPIVTCSTHCFGEMPASVSERDAFFSDSLLHLQYYSLAGVGIFSAHPLPPRPLCLFAMLCSDLFCRSRLRKLSGAPTAARRSGSVKRGWLSPTRASSR